MINSGELFDNVKQIFRQKIRGGFRPEDLLNFAELYSVNLRELKISPYTNSK